MRRKWSSTTAARESDCWNNKKRPCLGRIKQKYDTQLRFRSDTSVSYKLFDFTMRFKWIGKQVSHGCSGAIMRFGLKFWRQGDDRILTLFFFQIFKYLLMLYVDKNIDQR